MVTKYRGRVGGQSRFLILWCQQTRAITLSLLRALQNKEVYPSPN
jgi:hypothetical protein